MTRDPVAPVIEQALAYRFSEWNRRPWGVSLVTDVRRGARSVMVALDDRPPALVEIDPWSASGRVEQVFTAAWGLLTPDERFAALPEDRRHLPRLAALLPDVATALGDGLEVWP
jgi:hypothetical protein